MKNLLTALTLLSALSAGHAYAEGTKKEHHAEMESMMKEKKECMKESKDNKVCHEKVMASCEQKMSKDECDKMMKMMHKKMEKMKK